MVRVATSYQANKDFFKGFFMNICTEIVRAFSWIVEKGTLLIILMRIASLSRENVCEVVLVNGFWKLTAFVRGLISALMPS